MNPSTEQQLREKIEKHLSEWFRGLGIETAQIKNSAEALTNIALQERKAWGEHVMEYAKMKINKYSIHAPRGYPKGTLARRQLLGSLDNWMNKRQRNQEEDK